MNYSLPIDVYKPIENISEVEIVYVGGDNSVSIARIIRDGKEMFGISCNKTTGEISIPTLLIGL